jgi:outer membrane receptor protein involved in Fe transport
MAALLPAFVIVAPATFAPQDGWAQQIEEVTVTARRSEENAQDIPVAVVSVGSEFIEKQNISATADIVKLAPGVQFDQSFTSNDTRISIRGVNSSRGRASVAVLVDGVDVSGESITVGGGSSSLNTRLLDLERVEIVKGPQSALYGRSAFAGAIN